VNERISKREALRRVYPAAYEQAEAGLGYAEFRSLGYAARRLVEQRFGIPADSISLDHNGDHGAAWRSFAETHPRKAAAMDVYFGERGEGVEPHTGRRLRFGTKAVREYVDRWCALLLDLDLHPALTGLGLTVPTVGPDGCYGGFLVIEKDGLRPALEAAGIGERFDVFLASASGKGTTALRELAEALAVQYPDVPVYTLHDLDRDGIVSGYALDGHDTKSYRWSTKPNVIDLGLTLTDVRRFGVEDESVSGTSKDDPRRLLEDRGRTREEIAYLVSHWDGRIWRGRRAELNGLIGKAWPEFVATKLKAAGAGKVIPDTSVLDLAYERAYRRASVERRIEAEIERLVTEAKEQIEEIVPPPDLDQRVRDLLEDAPTLPWHSAVARIVHGQWPDDSPPRLRRRRS
jgi:Topoisomerase 6 subunit A/Spo11, Toprim domain